MISEKILGKNISIIGEQSSRTILHKPYKGAFTNDRVNINKKLMGSCNSYVQNYKKL